MTRRTLLTTAASAAAAMALPVQGQTAPFKGDWDYLADVARRMDKVLGLV